MNDVIVPRCDFDSIRADYVIIFGEARRQGAMVLTFTVPDLAAINPLGKTFRDRVTKLNSIIRTEAERHGVVVMDFEKYPVAQDPRLWFADRLHGNELGHQIVAAALAWHSASTALTIVGPRPGRRAGEAARSSAGDERHRVGQALPGALVGKGIRRMRTGFGIEPKRPIPAVVPKSRVSEAASREP